MSKYIGMIGFSWTEEQPGSIWKEHVVERPYAGDVMNARIRNDTTPEKLNDEFRVNQDISIIADSFALKNYHHMKYATIRGVRWKITSISINYPRLTLSIGGLYNGPKPEQEHDEEEASCSRWHP